MSGGAAAKAPAARGAVGNPKPRVIRPGKRLNSLGPASAEHAWVSNRAAEAMLQISNSHLHTLKKQGEIRWDKQHGYNLADILERYQRMLRTKGALEENIEAICVREFEAGKLPQDVIVAHSLGIEVVHGAWNQWKALRSDPLVAQKVAERDDAKQSEEASRCRTCLRTKREQKTDSLRIVQEVTGDEVRTGFTLFEERACADFDIRCQGCRSLKATVSVDNLRARIRAWTITGAPQPVELPPLPETPGVDAAPEAEPVATSDSPAGTGSTAP